MSDDVDESDHKRWIVTLRYRGDLGVIDNEFHVEELGEIEELVERGPDWNSLIDGRFILNPKCRGYDETIEQTMKR